MLTDLSIDAAGEDLAMLAEMPAAFLAHCGLRTALKEAGYLEREGVGLLICVIPKSYRLEDYVIAAEYFFKKDSEIDWINPERSKRVFRTSEQSKKSSKDKQYELTVFDLVEANFLMTTSTDYVSPEIRFAATGTLQISSPSPEHINAARHLLGKPHLPDEIATQLALKPQSFVIAGLFKRDLDIADLSGLDLTKSRTNQGPTLEELPGYTDLKDWASGLRRDVALWRDGALDWSLVSHGALLSGPPGTGKTIFAQALANSCGFELVATSIGSWQAAGHLDDTLVAMREAFSSAARAGGAVLFIDELDGIGDRGRLRDEYQLYWRVVVNEFLSLTSTPADGVILVAASNFPEAIDPAVLRSGRIEERFVLGLPDRQVRAEILAYHLNSDIDLINLVDVIYDFEGWSGADLEKLARKAKARARVLGRTVTLEDVHAAAPARRMFTADEKHRLAVHEAGHAFVAVVLQYCRTAKIVIQESFDPAAASFVGGRTSYDVIEEALPTETSLKNRIAVALAGMAAEQLVFGDRSIGSGGTMGTDVQVATTLACRLVCSYGLGPVPLYVGWVENADTRTAFTPELEAAVNKILTTQYARSLAVLQSGKDTLINFAEQAVECQSLTVGEETFLSTTGPVAA